MEITLETRIELVPGLVKTAVYRGIPHPSLLRWGHGPQIEAADGSSEGWTEGGG